MQKGTFAQKTPKKVKKYFEGDSPSNPGPTNCSLINATWYNRAATCYVRTSQHRMINNWKNILVMQCQFSETRQPSSIDICMEEPLALCWNPFFLFIYFARIRLCFLFYCLAGLVNKELSIFYSICRDFG